MNTLKKFQGGWSMSGDRVVRPPECSHELRARAVGQA